MRSRRPFCRGSIPPGHCQFDAAAEAAPMAGWRTHAFWKIPWGFGRRFWQVLVGIPVGFCWGSPRGPWGFCWDSARVLWRVLLEPARGLGASARPAQVPHASTKSRRRTTTNQACSKSLSKELRAARAATWAAHHPFSHDSLAEWSKALASGASPKGRGFEPHSCHALHSASPL